jgi:hypothetical protein
VCVLFLAENDVHIGWRLSQLSSIALHLLLEFARDNMSLELSAKVRFWIAGGPIAGVRFALVIRRCSSTHRYVVRMRRLGINNLCCNNRMSAVRGGG